VLKQRFGVGAQGFFDGGQVSGGGVGRFGHRLPFVDFFGGWSKRCRTISTSANAFLFDALYCWEEIRVFRKRVRVWG
jgi:hypothetical protein